MATKLQESFKLTVEKREILGKKVKKLRKEGLIPANIYGEDFASQAISLPGFEFIKLLRKTGATQVIHLSLGKEEIPVMVHHVQLHPVTDLILHIDFRKVNLSKKIETEVPIKHTGEAPAVADKKGDLITSAETILVEALPTDIPTAIDVDLSSLKEAGDEIKVKDLKAKGNYTIVDEPEKALVRIIAHKEEDTTPELPVEPEAGETTETAPETPAEGEEQAPQEPQQDQAQSSEKTEK